MKKHHLKRFWTVFFAKVRRVLGGRKRSRSRARLLIEKKRRPKHLPEALAKARPKSSKIAEISAENEVADFEVLEYPQNLPEKGGGRRQNSRAFFLAADEFAGIQLSQHTRRAYTNDLKDFFSFVLLKGVTAKNWAETMSALMVAEFRDHLVGDRGLSKSTATRKIAVVKSFFKWARVRGLVGENPAELVRAFPQNQESKTGYLSRGEINRLLRDFNEISGMGLFRALSKVTVESLLMLGLRRSEAAAIRLGDLTYVHEEWLLRVQGKGNRERLLPLPPKLLRTWAQWLQRLYDEAPRETLLEAPAEWLRWLRAHELRPLLISTRSQTAGAKALSTSEIAHIVRKSSRRAGIVSRVSPHMLRATAITFALDEGATHRGVQQMAGWTSPLMISRYDKRLKDPKFSGLRHLKYAFEDMADSDENDAIEDSPISKAFDMSH